MNEDQSAVSVVAGGILDPVSLDAFFQEYWESKPLHISRTSANPFSSLISIEAIEELLSTNSLSFPNVQLSHAGHAIPISDYTDDNNVIVSSRVIERYRTGSTIVISHAHKLVSNLMSLCRSIEASLMMRCQTNAYLSPAANQGFNPHYDTHDVFILQVSGTKTFNFYSSNSVLPTSADRFNSEIHKVGHKTEEIVLSAGDTLYIPRGIVHDAVADEHEPSLHITLGVYPVLLHTVIEEVTQIALESDARLRRAVSQENWMLQTDAEATTKLIKEVLAEHIQVDVVSAALQRLRDDIALDSIPSSQGLLSDVTLPTVQLDSKLLINHCHILQLERMEHTVMLRLYGQVVEFPDPLGAAIEWLLEQQAAVQVQDIPALCEVQKLALVEQLATLNIIRVT